MTTAQLLVTAARALEHAAVKFADDVDYVAADALHLAALDFAAVHNGINTYPPSLDASIRDRLEAWKPADETET